MKIEFNNVSFNFANWNTAANLAVDADIKHVQNVDTYSHTLFAETLLEITTNIWWVGRAAQQHTVPRSSQHKREIINCKFISAAARRAAANTFLCGEAARNIRSRA
jgi:hypothetical protein